MFFCLASRRSFCIFHRITYSQYFTKSTFSLRNKIFKNRLLLDNVNDNNFRLYSNDSNIHQKKVIEKINLIELESTKEGKTEKVDGTLKEKRISLYERFKAAYKDYGKLLVIVHLLTSCCWLSLFSVIIYSGVNVAAILRILYFPDYLVTMISNSALGIFAGAYVLYKLFSPVRYAITFYATKNAASLLRARGLMRPISDANRLTSLAKEGRALSKEFITKKRDDSKLKIQKTLEQQFRKKP